ncbi:LexA family protein [Oceanospirillum sediminis]|uniref:Helix-turn-helix domain-containing protein n=1 Tax=Oceanospirillum sediminis TaxID=2760088 RepID=A0A839IYB7_9GAMM|nr:S24 family peptidase [Oceanospirillum sediminis]MBB1489076.1 helix-turn-helix domain-containing protein [Oceanospirillum sediminis]
MINERIKQRRKELGLTQQDIANKLKITKASISLWENGSTQPKGENLFALSKVLNCSQEWLLYGKGDIKPASEIESNVAPGPEIKRRLPLVNWVQAGTWTPIVEADPSEIESYPCPVACSERSYVLRVQGASMEPEFRDGDLIFVDPEAQWKHGSYIVVRMDDDNSATFKQLIIESGKKYLKPLNPNWPEQIISINGNCTIEGVVIFSGRTF